MSYCTHIPEKINNCFFSLSECDVANLYRKYLYKQSLPAMSLKRKFSSERSLHICRCLSKSTFSKESSLYVIVFQKYIFKWKFAVCQCFSKSTFSEESLLYVCQCLSKSTFSRESSLYVSVFQKVHFQEKVRCMSVSCKKYIFKRKFAVCHLLSKSTFLVKVRFLHLVSISFKEYIF